MEAKEVVQINGVKHFRVGLTEAMEAAQQGKTVEITTYTHGRKPRSILKLELKEKLGDTVVA
tara:strand:- start:17444 stop:17629 length:186 start_codon:yes stop_codon:yes gene_type:complete